MSPADPALLDAAALWAARTRDAGFRDWDGFTAWLEADPRRNEAYELALDAHDAAGSLGDSAPAEAVAMPVASGRRIWRPAWLAVAAAAVVAAVVAPSLLPRHDRYEVVTAAGEQRSVQLADGTQIALNGDTRLMLDRLQPRAVVLDHGEAHFIVVHDAAEPFVVRAGATRIQDVGTSFNVRRGSAATDVAVAAGSVVYDPDGAQVKLAAGATLHDPDGVGAVEVAHADPEAIGAWRQGRLVFHDTPLGVVAADLARATGQRVSVAADMRSRAFSGTIVFRDVGAPQLFSRVAALTGTRAMRHGDGWLLSSEAGAPR